MTLAFSLGITSNMSLYARHSSSFSSFSLSRIEDIVEGNDDGTMAEVEWDYDVNRLLHAAWMLCAYAWALPSILYLAMRLSRGGFGGGNGGGGGGGGGGERPRSMTAAATTGTPLICIKCGSFYSLSYQSQSQRG